VADEHWAAAEKVRNRETVFQQGKLE
jgi:hypothetical protein